MDKKELSEIKQFISKQVGSKVRLESNKRHNKSVVNEGIIADVYPSIFTLEMSSQNEKNSRNRKRTVTYSYTDLLTNSVELTTLEQYAVEGTLHELAQ